MSNQSAENKSLLSRITMCRLGYAKGTETEEILYQAHNEIERLQNIQRDFHNLDDVGEIDRLRRLNDGLTARLDELLKREGERFVRRATADVSVTTKGE